MDNTQACRLVSRWIEGKPEVSIIAGAKVNGREQHEIRSYRCTGCGFLESYAPIA